MITLQQFVSKWTGVGVNPDHDPYGFQCVELANEWCIEIGIEEFGGNAVDFASDPHPDCDWVPNTPSGVPDPGDIVVWAAMPGDPYGHVAVFVSGDANAFSSFDQNWPLGSLPHVQAHNWNYVLGWYHPHVLDGQGAGGGPGPNGSVTFTGVVDADGGAHVRTLPGTDSPIVEQPGPNPDVVDKGTALTFDAWCHHPPAMPDAITGALDDRWFRTTAGHWIASAVVNGNPPDSMAPVPDPVAAPPGQSAPSPPPAESGDPNLLSGVWCWEWEDQADYADLAKLGYSGVLVRAANGEGGPNDATFETNWQARVPLARAAGLKVCAWTFWYGPGDQGYTEPDAAAYHMREAAHTADLGFDTGAWVVDFESHDATGLAEALSALRARSAKSVLLCPPGDPKEYGTMGWPWKDIDAAVDGYVPQFYTGAWQGQPSLDQALAEWSATPPLYPASDEQDPAAAAAWVADVKQHGFKGYSYWRSGVGSEETLKAYSDRLSK